MITSRRSLIRTAAVAGLTVGVGGALAGLDTRPSAAAPTPSSDPFTLGIASGDPSPYGVVLWTRLAQRPLAGDGKGGMQASRYPVQWQIATDEKFRRVVREGVSDALPKNAHSVHVELEGLRPGTEYFYRFRLGWHVSPTGRTRTAPAPNAMPASMTMAFASCSHYEQGWFTAYRHLAADQPDLVLHLGDYQYEYIRNNRPTNVRDHRGPETVTLANYRQRQAQYKSDPDLQAAHAAAPWLVVFDDHEVDNNWADEIPENAASVPGFMKRRAAAFRAYYENMPLRRSSLPDGPDMRLHRKVQWGRLANFHMLDTRQYRDDQACGDGTKDCPEVNDPTRSLLGEDQEQWLAEGFTSSRQRWDVLGQQIFYSRRASTPSPANIVSLDSWDGYAPSRDRVTKSWMKAGVRNPIVLTGDVHAHWASDILQDFRVPDSPVVGSEFITSSITSGSDGYDEPTGQHPWAAHNPNLKFWTNLRGYVNTTIRPDSFRVHYRCVPKVTIEDQPAFTRATFEVQDRVRGMQQVAAAQPDVAKRAATAPRSDEQKIKDTLEAESH